jgi:hypothetical protein
LLIKLLCRRKLENFDAIIATGSNNTARYFEYYFRDKPSIISRNSVAVLNGKETKEQLAALGEDIFAILAWDAAMYRNFCTKGYTLMLLKLSSNIKMSFTIRNMRIITITTKLFPMSNFKLDNGFLTLKEDTSPASPISSVFYEISL